MVRSGASCSPTQSGHPCCGALHDPREDPVSPEPPRKLGGNLGKHSLRARRRSAGGGKILSTPSGNVHPPDRREEGVGADDSRMLIDDTLDQL